MKKVLFVFNPKSGKEQIRNKLLDIVNIFSEADCELTIYATQKPGEASAISRSMGEDKELVVCSGGDGTLNEAVTGLMDIEEGQRPVLGYIPSGSTNDFAASLGLSKNMILAAKHIISGSDYQYDVGKFGDSRYFMYIAAFGAFTEVSYKTPQETKNVLGHQAYMLEAVKRVTNLKPYHMKFQWEDKELEEEFILGMVTNTISIGGFKGLTGLNVALDDGEFEVLLVRNPRAPKDISSIVSYLLTKEGENDCVYKFKASSICITSVEEVDWTLDGEFGGSLQSVKIDNLRRQITIRKQKIE